MSIKIFTSISTAVALRTFNGAGRRNTIRETRTVSPCIHLYILSLANRVQYINLHQSRPKSFVSAGFLHHSISTIHQALHESIKRTCMLCTYNIPHACAVCVYFFIPFAQSDIELRTYTERRVLVFFLVHDPRVILITK
jgi:hypothetical protein